MKTTHWLLLGLILIGSIFMGSCGSGTEIDNGIGTIRIVSLTSVPSDDPYNDGVSYDFTVVVAYTLENTDDAEIVVGFGEQAADGLSAWFSHDDSEIVTPTSVEVTKTYTFSKTLYDATSPDVNIFAVSLNPYPVDGIFTPYDSEDRIITVNP